MSGDIKSYPHFTQVTRVYVDSKSRSDRTMLWSSHVRKEWMIALFMGTTCLYAGRTIMPISSVFISSELHWNRREMGTVLGAFFWGYCMTQFLGGHLSDVYGGETVVNLAAIGWASTTLLFPLIPHLVSDPQWLLFLFVAARVMQGLFQGFHYPSVGSMMASRVALKDRSFTFSFQCAGSHMGTLISGCIGSVLLEHFGWRFPFCFVGVAGLAWVGFVRTFMFRRRNRTLSGSVVKHVDAGIDQREPIPWRKILTRVAFWAMLAAHYCHANVYFILLSWLPSYFHDNFPDAKSWIFNVVPWLIAIPSTVGSGYMGDRMLKEGFSATLVRKVMTTFSLLGPAIFLLSLSLVTSYSGVLLCMAGAICCCGFHTSGILLNPQDIAPQYGGAVFGLMNMAGAIPGFIGVYVTGYILETTKSWTIVFTQTSAFCIIGWIIYLAFGTAQKLV